MYGPLHSPHNSIEYKKIIHQSKKYKSKFFLHDCKQLCIRVITKHLHFLHKWIVRNRVRGKQAHHANCLFFLYITIFFKFIAMHNIVLLSTPSPRIVQLAEGTSSFEILTSFLFSKEKTIVLPQWLIDYTMRSVYGYTIFRIIFPCLLF
jgi:hypothetical protein